MLKVIKEKSMGVFLDDGDVGILLPKRFVPPGTHIGDELKVFLYHDGEDRPIAQAGFHRAGRLSADAEPDRRVVGTRGRDVAASALVAWQGRRPCCRTDRGRRGREGTRARWKAVSGSRCRRRTSTPNRRRTVPPCCARRSCRRRSRPRCVAHRLSDGPRGLSGAA